MGRQVSTTALGILRRLAVGAALIAVLAACSSARTPTPVVTSTPVMTSTATLTANPTAPSDGLSGARAAPQPEIADATCDSLPVDQKGGTDGHHTLAIKVPSIPFPTGGEREGGFVWFQYELTNGPSDRSTAEQLAKAERASFSTFLGNTDRYVVIEVNGQYRAFSTGIIEVAVGDPNKLEVNPILKELCKLSPARARLVTVYAFHHTSDAYYNSEWTVENGHLITDANTGEILVSGQGGGEPPAGVPFEPGAAADAWLLDNINGRNLGVTCQNARPDVSAWGDGAIAQVGCSGSTAYDALWYTLYDSDGALQAYWNKRTDIERSAVATDVCGSNTWIFNNNNADPKGGLMCERVTNQAGAVYAQIEWTEDDWRIAATVYKENADISTLWALWTQASSLPRAP